MMKPYASQPNDTRGRLYSEELSTFRSPFQRDRDRIIHSSAFRRLKHKTQVFVEHEGDYYRTRLTHSIEVAQVARTMAGALGLNEGLAEAVALAHDLGHSPFGHTGEDALELLMAPYGGFDHNAQALRIVTKLEKHYATFDGLNLTWESLEGIAKHNGPIVGPYADKKKHPEDAPLPYALKEVNDLFDLELHTFASAEAQVAAIADDVAYNHHDLHDGLRAGLFTAEDLMELPLTGPAYEEVDRLYPGLERNRRDHEALRRIFGYMVEDVLTIATNRLEAAKPETAQDIRDMDRTIIRFSKPFFQNLKAIKSFLFTRMYRAPSVVRERQRVTHMVNTLFPLFMEKPELLPEEWRHEVENAQSETELARIVLDYVAGMTDRFAIQEYERLCA
ncbi:deoxyguanosinetriphosphate triphosphohydrolase [Celeribacter halophilus]|jgi:dGTPase|uniref:Deoxyguanosinetriphosphate triphosphohydrolase-like protein n=1 Tax=Celeribacter halophilus TaxID=576117 RepID=A0AAW7XN04_9RHOB|nr:deoxyguanosinetriphosphate triphosphohydrolase [Celeribacter halophilus]MBU2890561.1 deoxyguanosinetriphosphate triphosphohydrolase [Celeribacter halophilus]MDO6455699.1 deoxyguanosinetriphosphate triphosphohydrolase [Celeribacter halophilus]MDO6511640.1 deoxyguanosinetriphosphate triphosphohydrolase [Celeribacter halophilus]MDO6721889.1 deoxyguanosinetriphosphate triphosphohydrolase [Celeribacter halophilus]